MRLPFFTRTCVAVSGLFVAASCSDNSSSANDPNLIGFNDYETVIGWMSETSSITREQAHSGRYAVKVAPGIDFGMGYGMPLGKATARKPRKIRISAWAFMTDNNSTARLGMQLFDASAGQVAFSDGIDYAEQVKTPRKWTEISKDITIPATATPELELRVFLWRGSAGTPAYIDDLRISLVE